MALLFCKSVAYPSGSRTLPSESSCSPPNSWNPWLSSSFYHLKIYLSTLYYIFSLPLQLLGVKTGLNSTSRLLFFQTNPLFGLFLSIHCICAFRSTLSCVFHSYRRCTSIRCKRWMFWYKNHDYQCLLPPDVWIHTVSSSMVLFFLCFFLRCL